MSLPLIAIVAVGGMLWYRSTSTPPPKPNTTNVPNPNARIHITTHSRNPVKEAGESGVYLPYPKLPIPVGRTGALAPQADSVQMKIDHQQVMERHLYAMSQGQIAPISQRPTVQLPGRLTAADGLPLKS